MIVPYFGLKVDLIVISLDLSFKVMVLPFLHKSGFVVMNFLDLSLKEMIIVSFCLKVDLK